MSFLRGSVRQLVASYCENRSVKLSTKYLPHPTPAVKRLNAMQRFSGQKFDASTIHRRLSNAGRIHAHRWRKLGTFSQSFACCAEDEPGR